jgi:uncharacterized protein YggE
MRNTLGFLLAAAALAAAPAYAQQADSKTRNITVSGEASGQIAPDRAILSMSAVSRNTNLQAAKQANDEMVEKLVKITQQFKIPQEKVATSQVSIAPEYTYDNAGQHFKGYIISRSFRVTMDDLGVPEKLLSAIVDAKIDQVSGIEFTLADPEAHAAPLRIKAFENARAKADALAKAAGAKLGPAMTIIAGENSGMAPPRPMPMMAMAGRAESSVAPSLPGLIELSESVSVTFGLE